MSTGLSIENAFSADGIRVIPVPELLAFEPPAWVVKPFIELGARGIIYGPSDIGKTFLCLDMALSIATGRQWCAFKTLHAPIAYICAEGSRALGRRVQGWLQYHNKTAADITDTFHTIGSPVQLVRESQRDELLKALVVASPTAPALIIVDTLSWCGLGMDENDSGAMTQLIGGAALLQRCIAAEYKSQEPAVLFVHHTGKNKKGIRGAYSLTAASDFVFSYGREKDATLSKLQTERVKDGPRSKPLSFEAVEVTLGIDEDGAAITTCVAIPVGYAGAQPDGPTPNQAKILAVLAAGTTPVHRYSDIKQKTGIHDGPLCTALKVLTDDKKLVTRCKGGGYRLLLATPNAQISDSSNVHLPLLSSSSLLPYISLDIRGGKTREEMEEGKKGVKPIVLGTPVRFAQLADFDHDSEPDHHNYDDHSGEG